MLLSSFSLYICSDPKTLRLFCSITFERLLHLKRGLLTHGGNYFLHSSSLRELHRVPLSSDCRTFFLKVLVVQVFQLCVPDAGISPLFWKDCCVQISGLTDPSLPELQRGSLATFPLILTESVVLSPFVPLCVTGPSLWLF